MRWTLQQVAGALGVAAPGGLDPLARLAGVSIDSRTVARAELFVAIHGPRHDGHAFVAQALAGGALAAVVARARVAEYPEALRGKLFAVDDTLGALQHLAREVRRAWGRRLAAVTGSVGKTTTKEILAALLAARLRVLKSEGNLNNEYGLPLALLRLDDAHEAAAVELGMSHRGEIARLAEIAEPSVGVVTRVAPVHLEFFSSVDEVAHAKRELIEGLRGKDSVAVLNADDERVARFAEVAPGRVVTFGFSERADFRAAAVEDRGVEGTTFELVAPGERGRLTLPLAGRHNVANALAALAAAGTWGIGIREAQRALANLAPAAMRGEILRFEAGFTVINDSYNSNPIALDAMVDLLAATPGYRRSVLVAGEMLELGPSSAELHRKAGEHAARKQINCIFGVRGEAANLVRGAEDAGRAAETRFFASSDEAAAFVAGFVKPGDLVLVKGSRGVKMERVVEALKSRFALAGAAPEVASPKEHG